MNLSVIHFFVKISIHSLLKAFMGKILSGLRNKGWIYWFASYGSYIQSAVLLTLILNFKNQLNILCLI